MLNTCGLLVGELRTVTPFYVRFFTYATTQPRRGEYKHSSLFANNTHTVHYSIHTFFMHFTPVINRVIPSFHSTNKKLQKVLTKNLLLITGKVV